MMRVFQNRDGTRRVPAVAHLVVRPAKHLRGNDASNPVEWYEANSETGTMQPVQFKVEFIHGVATVPDHLGKYLIEFGYATSAPVRIIRQAEPEGLFLPA